MLRLLIRVLLLQRLLRRYSPSMEHKSNIRLTLERQRSVHGSVALLTKILRQRLTAIATTGVARDTAQRWGSRMLKNAFKNWRAVQRRWDTVLLLLLQRQLLLLVRRPLVGGVDVEKRRRVISLRPTFLRDRRKSGGSLKHRRIMATIGGRRRQSNATR